MKPLACSIHGDQQGVVGICVDVTYPDGRRIQRLYCMQCWVAWMDDNLLPLGEIDASPPKQEARP